MSSQAPPSRKAPRSEDTFLNRELSWIHFNERVLALAEDDETPLLERAKFLAIFASNLDEFYMVRVAGLKRQLAAGVLTKSPDGLTARQQLEKISEKVRPVVARHALLFCDEILPALTHKGVRVARWSQLDARQRDELHLLFQEQIFPVVTPLAVDPGHPFPYISNLSLNLAVQVADPLSGRIHFARIKVPPVLSRFTALSQDGLFVPIEDVIAANLDKLFPGMTIVEHHTFRVTRNADLEVDDDGAEDLLEALEEELQKRRFAPAVRLEIESNMPPHILRLLQRELEIQEQDVHPLPGPLDLSGLWHLYEPFPPVTHERLVSHDDSSPDMFEVLSDEDMLVHHPYDSFATSVQRLIEQAASDPHVLAIKQTLYRTSGDSPIVDALVQAATSGKQVVVLVEIKARFDEQANINWARMLEQAGCHVVYGVIGLKTHAKLCLIVRREEGRMGRYVHVGTGNYNPRTARIYEDMGLLTSDPQLGSDVSHLFNYLTGYSRETRYPSLIVAPDGMRAQILELIEKEASSSTPDSPGRIVMKVNNLVDEGIIEGLYAASRAGVEIDLIVRGICALRPGLEGTSETIRVRSILGRFLEHSRIFYFQHGGGMFYLGSADMMHRNLDRRVEALARIRSPGIQKELRAILELAHADNCSAWELRSDATWSRVPKGDEVVNLQRELMHQAGGHE